jgi:hypothetical protein
MQKYVWAFLFIPLALGWQGCAVYKVESLTAQGMLPEHNPIFVHSGNADSYEADVSLIFRNAGDLALQLHDTLKYDSSGRVMAYPPRPEREIADPVLHFESVQSLVGLSLVQRLRHWDFSASAAMTPQDIDFCSLGAGVGYSREMAGFVPEISLGWTGNRIRQSTVYHENSPSHTDLETIYIRHSSQGLVWASSRSLTLGLLYRTRLWDPFLSVAWEAHGLTSLDDDFGDSPAHFHSLAIKAGASADIFLSHPMGIFFGLMRTDARAVGDATVVSAGMTMGWRYRGHSARN